MKLKDWSAKRAFKGLVVTGLDHRGKEQKIVNVYEIALRKGKIVATDMDKKRHELLLPAAEPAALPDTGARS